MKTILSLLMVLANIVLTIYFFYAWFKIGFFHALLWSSIYGLIVNVFLWLIGLIFIKKLTITDDNETVTASND